MKACDLLAELTSAAVAMDQVAIDRLHVLGVSGDMLAELAEADGAPPIGVVPIVEDAGLFVPSPEGRAHLVQPVIANGEIVDLVAWRSDHPRRWLLRTGLGWALGEDNLTERSAWDAREPFSVWSTPLSWLHGGGIGICILDWSAPEFGALGVLHSIAPETPALGRLIVSTLSKPARLPLVQPMEARDAA